MKIISKNKLNNTPSKGNQEKYHIDDYWYKTDYLGYEGASEYLVTEILKQSNIKYFVEYSMEKIEKIDKDDPDYIKQSNGCKSKNFCSDGIEIVTINSLIKNNLGISFDKFIDKLSTKDAIEKVVDFVKAQTGLDKFGEYLGSILELDAFILNEDRHMNNILVLKDKEGKYNYAPIFDNGAAFLSDTTNDYILGYRVDKLMDKVKAKPFSSHFSKQVKAARELYGAQLFFDENLDISKALFNIRQLYGSVIADRMGKVFSINQIKYHDMFIDNIKEKECLDLSPNWENENEKVFFET